MRALVGLSRLSAQRRTLSKRRRYARFWHLEDTKPGGFLLLAGEQHRSTLAWPGVAH